MSNIKVRDVLDRVVSIDKHISTDLSIHKYYYEIGVTDIKNRSFETYETSYSLAEANKLFTATCKKVRKERILAGEKEKCYKEKVAEVEFDVWLYPKDLGIDRVINIYRDGDFEIMTNEYSLPKDWKRICVPIGNESIHNVMVEI